MTNDRKSDLARRVLEQVIILGIVLATVSWLVITTKANLEERGIATGLGFLSSPANVGVSETWITFTPGVDTYARMIFAGFLNTLFVSLVVMVLATLVGLFVGLSRLAPNWLLSRSAGLYVELIRNVPLPLQLLIWYQLLLNLPSTRNAVTVFNTFILSNRGVWFPVVVWSQLHLAYFVGAAALIAFFIVARRSAVAKGEVPRLPGMSTALALIFVGFVCLIHLMPPELHRPELRGFNYRGGTMISPELVALIAGLTLYSGAFIGEIVRAGILSVPPGQWEAGRALGLPRKHMISRVVLPQSLRFAIPPLANEHLNIIKNSSLAVIIGYPELTSVINTMLSGTGQPIEAIAILMLAYLTISLCVSSFMHWYESRMALVSR